MAKVATGFFLPMKLANFVDILQAMIMVNSRLIMHRWEKQTVSKTWCTCPSH